MLYLAKWIRLIAAVGLISLPIAAACGKATPESSIPQSFEPSLPSPSNVASPTPLPPAPSNPGNVPSVPGTSILISVIDEQGQPVEEGKIEVSVEFQGNPQWDFSYVLYLSTLLPGGLLPLDPPSSDARVTVSIQVVTPAGEASDTLVVRGGFWEAVVATDLDYVAVHEFDLTKSGTTSNVVYTTEPQPYPKTQPVVGPGPGPRPITATRGPQQADGVDAEFLDRPLASEAREQEWSKVQGAMDNMMVDTGQPRYGFDWYTWEKPIGSEELAEALSPLMNYCIEQFGPDRCMFESNFPPDKVSSSYNVLFNAFKRLSKDYSASERASLFHDTATGVYRLDL